MDIDLGNGCNLLVLAFYSLTKTWGWITLSTLLAIVGFIFGATSHQITYQSVEHGNITPYFVNGGTDYLRENNGSTYYIIHEDDFPSSLKLTEFFSSGGFTIIVRSDAENVDVTFTDGTHLIGTGYQVEQIKFFDSNGLNSQVFSTSEYAQHPQGFYQDHWAIGRVLIIIGFILMGLTFLITLSRSHINLFARIPRLSLKRGAISNQQVTAHVLKTFLYTETWSETYTLLEQEKRVLLTEEAEELLVTVIAQAKQNKIEQSELLYLQLHLEMLHDARRLGVPTTVAKHKSNLNEIDTSSRWKISRIATITTTALTAFINAPWDKKRQILEEEQVLLLTGRADSYCSLLLLYFHHIDLELCRFLLRRSREVGISVAWVEFERMYPSAERVNVTPFVGLGPLVTISPFVRLIHELLFNPAGKKLTDQPSQPQSKAIDHINAFLGANFWFEKRDVLKQEQALLLTEIAEQQLTSLITRARQKDIPELVKYLEIHATLLRRIDEVGLTNAWAEFEATHRNVQASWLELRKFGFSSDWTELQTVYGNMPEGLNGIHAFLDNSLEPLFNEIAVITYPDEAIAVSHPQEIPRRIELLREMIDHIDAGQGNRVAWAEMQISLAQALEISWMHQPSIKMAKMEEAIDCYRNALSVYTAENFPHNYSKVLSDLGNLYYMRGAGSQRDNQEEAIACYHKALSTSTLSFSSFVETYNNLGAIYENRIMGKREDNLRRAIICCNISLALLDPSSPRAAQVKMNLGGAHNTLAKLDGGYDSREQEQAIIYYREALQVVTRDANPLQYIRLLINLANVYLDRIKGSPTENIELAISSLQEAQQLCTLDIFPYEYTVLQQNLAIAFWKRTVGTRSQNLHKAMECLHRITDVFTSDNAPREFINAQFNIAKLASNDLYDEAVASDDKVGISSACKMAHQALDAACHVQTELGWLESDEDGRSRLLGQQNAYEMYALNAWCLWQLGDLRKAVVTLEAGRTQALIEALSIQMVSQESLCSIHAIAFAQASQNLQEVRRNGDRAVKRNARDRFLDVRQAIRQCSQCNQPNFLPDDPSYQDIVLAASNQAIVYLVATYRGGVAFIVPPTQEQTDVQRHFPAAIALPHLTLQVAYNWLTSVDSDGNAVGGICLSVQQLSDTLLRNWNNRIGLKNAQQQRMTVPLQNVAEVLPDDMNTLRRALQYVVKKWSSRADRLSSGSPHEQEEARMLRRQLAMPLGEALVTGILKEYHELDWCFQQAELERLLPELSKIIMLPIRQGLNALGLDSPALPIALIPCGRLSPLPLHAAFVDHPQTGMQVPFQETCEFTYQPSARSLSAARKVAAGLPADGPIIAVGNPQGANLCYAEQEARANVQQARRKGRTNSTDIVDAEATLSRVLCEFQNHKKLRSGAWIEIASHGYTDPADPHNSYMQLAQEEKLTLTMLRNEHLLIGVRCFSALGCVTGSIDLNIAPDELTSFAAGVLQAGAASAIATLWSVSDKASFFLMLRFHYVLLNNSTKTPAWILREAVKWLRTATRKDLDEMLRISGVNRNTLDKCIGLRGVGIGELPDGLRGISQGRPIKTSRKLEQYDALSLNYFQEEHNERHIPFAHPIYWASTIIYGV